MHHPPARDNSSGSGRRLPGAAAVLGLALGAGLPAAAVEVSGVQVPDSVSVDGTNLALNGAGLRSRFFVRVYVGALYLTEPGATTTEQVLSASGSKRVSMHVIYDELSQEKITSAWMDGFKDNTPQRELSALLPRIERFNALWPALKAGDVAHVDLIPGRGVRVSVNGASLGTVEGEDLQHAVLRIWLGEKPADADLKRGMLGGG